MDTEIVICKLRMLQDSPRVYLSLQIAADFSWKVTGSVSCCRIHQGFFTLQQQQETYCTKQNMHQFAQAIQMHDFSPLQNPGEESFIIEQVSTLLVNQMILCHAAHCRLHGLYEFRAGTAGELCVLIALLVQYRWYHWYQFIGGTRKTVGTSLSYPLSTTKHWGMSPFYSNMW